MGGRSESPPLLTAQQRDRDVTATSPPPRGIIRQVSGVRNPVPSVGILASSGSQHPPAPLSPPRGLASPPSPQQTPGTMYRKATSSLTSLAANAMYPPGFNGGHGQVGDAQPGQQMTSRSNGSGAAAGFGPQARGGNLSDTQKVRKHGHNSSDTGVGLRAESAFDGRAERSEVGRRHSGPDATTVAEVVTDSRGDVLHRMTNVILLSPHQGIANPDREQQLKVRGQIIGTYWDERDIGPALEHPWEVQVMVTYVDATERSVPLLFPTKEAQTFGDTETAEGNIIKWKAQLCKVGKKFS